MEKGVEREFGTDAKISRKWEDKEDMYIRIWAENKMFVRRYFFSEIKNPRDSDEFLVKAHFRGLGNPVYDHNECEYKIEYSPSYVKDKLEKECYNCIEWQVCTNKLLNLTIIYNEEGEYQLCEEFINSNEVRYWEVQIFKNVNNLLGRILMDLKPTKEKDGDFGIYRDT